MSFKKPTMDITPPSLVTQLLAVTMSLAVPNAVLSTNMTSFGRFTIVI